MDVVCFLERVQMLDEMIKAKIAERDQLWDLATNITPVMSGMPHGGGVSDKVGNLAAKLADLARETNDLIDMYIDHKANVIQTLEKLPAKEFGVLHRIYVQHMTMGECASDMGYSTVQIWRIKRLAMLHLQDVIACNTMYVV